MRYEVRKYSKSVAGYALVTRMADHENHMKVAHTIAKRCGVSDRAIAFALGLGQAAFGIGQRDKFEDGSLRRELSVSVPGVKGIDLVVVETNQYEEQHAIEFKQRNPLA